MFLVDQRLEYVDVDKVRQLLPSSPRWPLPLLFGSPHSTAPLHLGLPRVHSGDEPHYLVLINSVVLDGDLETLLTIIPPFTGARRRPATIFLAGALDHHTVWFEGGSRKQWKKNLETDPAHWDRDSEGHPVPRLRAGQPAPLDGHPEFSTQYAIE
jgi:hypothetical protein